MKPLIIWDDFEKLDIRVGTILTAVPFKKAKNAAYILTLDFGKEIGVKKTSAQITALYTPKELVGKQVTAVVNFPPKQIANIMSECLLIGAVDGDLVTLLKPEQNVPNGLQVG